MVVANLEGASKRVMARMEGRTSLTDRIFGREAFDAEFGSALECGRRMSDQDLDVLLVYMARDARQIACDGKVSRFVCGADHKGKT